MGNLCNLAQGLEKIQGANIRQIKISFEQLADYEKLKQFL